MERVRQTVCSSVYVAALWFLVLIFCLRVIGQLVQTVSPVSWLPPPAAWQGSAFPYPILLASQLVLIVVMSLVARRHATASVPRRTSLGKWLLLAGSVYFLVMAGRLLAGLADLSADPWVQRTIPAFFHLVLASYVLLLAAFHLNWLSRESREKR